MTVYRPITHPDPLISVVIPTLPENDYEIVRTLQNQTISEYEVVVVSDESLDIAEARNQGMQRANADIVAHTDDDCLPPTTWIEQIYTVFAANPDAVILGGCLDKHSAGPHNYIGANVAYRRDAALQIGGYDSELAGWREDTDFGLRMETAYGMDQCVFAPEIKVYHKGPLRTSFDRDLEQKFRARYPVRYFTYFGHPQIPFGKKIGLLTAFVYRNSPAIGESLFTLYRRSPLPAKKKYQDD